MAIGMKLQPAMIFGENMVLQRGKSIPVWGRGAFGETVTVTLGENTASAPVVDGFWRVELPAMEATWQTDMIIAAEPSGERVEFHRVAVGEVWLAGGQSNMEFRVKYDKNVDELRAAPSDAYLRHFRYPEVSFPAQLDLNTYPTDGVWRPWDMAFNGEFSAAGSYFALQLRKRLGVPIGILSCNYGGTPTSALDTA